MKKLYSKIVSKFSKFPKLMISETSGSVYLITSVCEERSNCVGTKLTVGSKKDNGESVGYYSNRWELRDLVNFYDVVEIGHKEG